jgi:hypothetical protein
LFPLVYSVPSWNIPVTNRKALGLGLSVDKTCAEYFNGLMEKLKKESRTKEERRGRGSKRSGVRKEGV